MMLDYKKPLSRYSLSFRTAHRMVASLKLGALGHEDHIYSHFSGDKEDLCLDSRWLIGALAKEGGKTNIRAALENRVKA